MCGDVVDSPDGSLEGLPLLLTSPAIPTGGRGVKMGDQLQHTVNWEVELPRCIQ